MEEKPVKRRKVCVARYTDEEIQKWLELGEDSHHEFKQVVFRSDKPFEPHRNRWAKEITAFANTQGGTLLCGVTDTGDIQDMSKQQMENLEKLLSEICKDSIKPTILVTILRRSLQGKKFLLVDIPEGDEVYKSPDGYFYRIGSSIQEMTEERRLRLVQKRGQIRFKWFDEQPVPETGFQTLNKSLWNPLLTAEGKQNPQIALRKMKLLTDDDKGIERATVAGLLLCSLSPDRYLPQACITATCYRGGDRASGQIDTKNITGPLDQQVAQAMNFVIRNTFVSAHKTPGRINLPQYSEKALFEALVNAVVHRDYSLSGSSVRLSIFKDRIEIQSPGDLPNSLTIESIDRRQSTRNEVLTSVLRYMSVRDIKGAGERQYIMEKRGDGVTIIQRETKALGSKQPEYKLIDHAELLLTIFAAPIEHSHTHVDIVVQSNGHPVANVNVLTLFPNHTYKSVVTDANGQANVELYSDRLPMNVFAVAQDFSAYVQYNWHPNKKPLIIELKKLSRGGSVIFKEATGHIPGLTGRLNPIRDTIDRTYLYASNISINDGKPQPVDFALKEDLHLIDADGHQVVLRVIEILGRAALVEYQYL